jgi:hypothetical protein
MDSFYRSKWTRLLSLAALTTFCLTVDAQNPGATSAGSKNPTCCMNMMQRGNQAAHSMQCCSQAQQQTDADEKASPTCRMMERGQGQGHGGCCMGMSSTGKSAGPGSGTTSGQMSCPMGMAGGEGMRDMQTIHALFAQHEQITRKVTRLDNGVETVTESADPKVRGLIVEHARAMKIRLESKQPVRQWDPLFAALFANGDKINLQIVETAKGVRVIETSSEPQVVKLIQAHADALSEFVRDGMSAMHKSHDVPK